jgi:hypothetical protein
MPAIDSCIYGRNNAESDAPSLLRECITLRGLAKTSLLAQVRFALRPTTATTPWLSKSSLLFGRGIGPSGSGGGRRSVAHDPPGIIARIGEIGSEIIHTRQNSKDRIEQMAGSLLIFLALRRSTGRSYLTGGPSVGDAKLVLLDQRMLRRSWRGSPTKTCAT